MSEHEPGHQDGAHGPQDEQHRALREMLGSYLLGHLDPAGEDRVRAHLDGCATCRAELEDIAPLAPLLDDIDPTSFASPPTPPPTLGARIRETVREEGEAHDRDELVRRRTAARAVVRRRLVLGVVAAAVLVGGVTGGALLGRGSAPDAPVAAPVALEQIALEPVGATPAVAVDSAGVVAHAWGVELRMEAEGFTRGEVFRAAFRDEQGDLAPAGRFLGTGRSPMTCALQSGVLREDVTAVLVFDEDGETVLRSTL